MSESEPGYLSIYVCECGVVSSGWANARCGRRRTQNIRIGCPAKLVEYVSISALTSEAACKAGDDANDDVAWRGSADAVIDAAIAVAKGENP